MQRQEKNGEMQFNFTFLPAHHLLNVHIVSYLTYYAIKWMDVLQSEKPLLQLDTCIDVVW